MNGFDFENPTANLRAGMVRSRDALNAAQPGAGDALYGEFIAACDRVLKRKRERVAAQFDTPDRLDKALDRMIDRAIGEATSDAMTDAEIDAVFDEPRRSVRVGAEGGDS